MADVLRDLRRRQLLRQQDGRWVIAEDLSTLEDELPRSVMSLIQRKLEALDDADRRLLTAASVQGLDFDSAIVARALGQEEDDVEDRLDRLEREHALVRFVDEYECPDRSLTLRYRFAHHLYHNTISDSLRITRRVALSRAIADGLIARMAGKADNAADIALILETARDNVRAAEYWNRAAQGAARLYAHAETERLAQARAGAAGRRARHAATRRRGARPADDLRAGDQDQPGLRHVGRRERLRSGARTVSKSRGSGAGRARPDRAVSAPHRLGRNPHRARDLHGDARPLPAAGRSAPADDRRVVRGRRPVPSRRSRRIASAARARAVALRSGVPSPARVADGHRAGHLLPLRVTRGR